MVVMGRVVAPFGIKGWIKIQPFTERVDTLSQYSAWWVGQGSSFHLKKVAESAVHGQTVIARLEATEDRVAAAVLKGQDIAIRRDQLPRVDLGTYYWDDLVGCEVTNVGGKSLGSVAKILETSGNSVLVVVSERERLLPFIASIILDVDIESKRVHVDWDVDF